MPNQTSPADAGQNFSGLGPERIFAEALAQGRFTIQRCQECRAHLFYPRVLCPHCSSARLDWITPSGLGTVYSYTVVRKRAEHGGDYNVALIDLDEGPRMMSRVEGLAADAVRIGMRVKVDFAKQADGKNLIVFRPTNDGPVDDGARP